MNRKWLLSILSCILACAFVADAFAYERINVVHKEFGKSGLDDAAGAAKNGSNFVYRSLNGATGKVQYVGITNNMARRAAEHLSERGIQIEKLMGGLARSDARAVEQVLIEVYGLEKNGGSLINQINSIARTNPSYAWQLDRGFELLKSIGYTE